MKLEPKRVGASQLDAVTLDQLKVLATVIEEGSFSAAARKLGRAQSAISYAVNKLEEQIGTALFDRASYRPVLSQAGRALLPRVRRILDDVAQFRLQASGFADGLEPELSLVVDAMIPMERLVRAFKEFQALFPSVQMRIYVEALGAAVQRILDGSISLGIVADIACGSDELDRVPAFEVELVAVAAADHPLARLSGAIEPEACRDHVQLVLTDRSTLTQGQDHGVLAVSTWRLADLGAKHAMLLAGLGWGSMPEHMIADDVAAGRLVRLTVSRWADSDQPPNLLFVTAQRRDRVLGPAGRWMAARLAAVRGDGKTGPLTG